MSTIVTNCPSHTYSLASIVFLHHLLHMFKVEREMNEKKKPKRKSVNNNWHKDLRTDINSNDYNILDHAN